MRTVLISLLVLAVAPAAAQAGTAHFVVDLRALNALGPSGITANATKPADAYLRGGKAYLDLPVARTGSTVTFKGGLIFSKGSKKTVFTSLSLSGSTLSGRYKGRALTVLKFSGVRRSGKAITTGKGGLTGQSASVLRKSFKADVFRSGLGFFTSGRIPL